MKNIRVLFYVYPSAFQNPGGGEIQLLMTKKYLEKEGVFVKLFDQWNDKLEDYDIIHTFGSVKDCLGLFYTAKSKGIKIALSSIFWSTLRRALYSQGDIKEKCTLAIHHLAKAILPQIPSSRKKMFELSDIILPNSDSEAIQVSRFFNIAREKFFVVPNGVEERFLRSVPDEFVNKYGIRDFILCVGRIEPRKNQLNVIKAVRNLDVQLVIIGDFVSEYKWYYDLCKRSATSNVKFLGGVSHDSTMLESAYSACKVFCLAGWFETPGLSALEAALSGANIVLTCDGSTKDYFMNMALYVKPNSVNDIEDKIKKALQNPKNEELKKYVRDNYLWDNVARKTKQAYEKILK